MSDEQPNASDEAPKKRIVTYEAADRGAVCCLGCQAWALILAGVALGVWYLFAGGLWRAVIALILLVGGIALARHLSVGRNRWEVSFDRDRRIVTLLSAVSGEKHVREIPFDSIEDIALREITRDTSAGENLPHQLPVFRLISGEEVALDERLSVRDPDRAAEVREEMRELLGLSPGAGRSAR
jgi:hypothetical protein